MTRAWLQPAEERSSVPALQVSPEAEPQRVLLALVVPAVGLLPRLVEQQVFRAQPERAGP